MRYSNSQIFGTKITAIQKWLLLNTSRIIHQLRVLNVYISIQSYLGNIKSI